MKKMNFQGPTRNIILCVILQSTDRGVGWEEGGRDGGRGMEGGKGCTSASIDTSSMN